MTVRVAINGFGRIGRNYLRAAKATGADINFVAINDLGDIKTMESLLRHDSVHGRFEGKISSNNKELRIDNDRILLFSERNPAELPWAELDIDVVIESTGVFNSKEAAGVHRTAGAKKVLISAPATCDATFVLGVNDHLYNPDRHHVMSNASCTTNCFAPMVKVLDDKFGIVHGLMTTAHGYTGDQNIVDAPHKDMRRARAAAVNIVPTTTGAARAVGEVIPRLNGHLDGRALRVPIPDGSITDFTAVLKKPATVEQVNKAFKDAASKGSLKPYLDYSEEPLVSSDIVGDPASCIFDSGLTMTMGELVKIGAWYDNEVGYSHRLVDLTKIVATRKTKLGSSKKKKAPAKKKAAAKKKAPAKKKAAKKKTLAKKTARKSTTATRSVAKKKKAPAKKKAVAKKKAPAKQKAVAKKKAPAKRKAAAKKKAPAKRKAAAKKKAPAKKKAAARK